MQLRVIALLAVLVGSLTGWAGQAVQSGHDVSLSDLPPVEQGKYKVEPYIAAAEQLQAAGRADATRQLIALAKSWAHLVQAPSIDIKRINDEQKIAVLCRMLFVKREGSTFDRPELGAPEFFGDPPGSSISLNNSIDSSCFRTWTLEPIEIVDGVPFLVVRGYSVEAVIEPHYMESYVRYCTTNCDWSSAHFTKKTMEQKRKALTKIFVSPKLGLPLEAYERDYLTQQIQ